MYRRVVQTKETEKIVDLCVYVAIASYCEKRHAYRDRCEIRHGPNRKKNNNSISEVIYYLNGGAGDDDDDDEELTFDVIGVEETPGVIG